MLTPEITHIKIILAIKATIAIFLMNTNNCYRISFHTSVRVRFYSNYKIFFKLAYYAFRIILPQEFENNIKNNIFLIQDFKL